MGSKHLTTPVGGGGVNPPTPLEADAALQAEEARLTLITNQIMTLKGEIQALQKSIQERAVGGDPSRVYDLRWKEIKLRLGAFVHAFFKNSEHLKSVQLEDCELRLRKIVGIHGAVFDWELVIPVADGDRQLLSLNNQSYLPGAYPEELGFIGWLKEQSFIKRETKIDPRY